MAGRWDDMRTFLAVAKAPSIKQAAVQLGTTQSAVSKRIARLEQDLGATLFVRGHKGTSLTYQGERVLSHALAAESALRRAEESASQANDRIKGDCSIQLSDGVANYWVAEFLPPFFSRYPDIELKVMIDTSEKPNQNELFDIRMHYMPPSGTDHIAKLLATVHFMPFAARSYVARFGMPQSVEDLTRHRLIDQAQYLISRGTWASWFENARLRYTSLFTNQSTFLARAVQAGAGIALMPTYMVIDDKDLVPIDIGMHLPLKLFASYRRENALEQPVRTTLNYLRDCVFNPKTMPWFGDNFVPPTREWRALRAAALKNAQSAPPFAQTEPFAAE
jgi:DNA-binding transcriptional LysR family regulator